MFGSTSIRHSSRLVLVAALFLLAGVRRADADGFISPFLGYNFGGDAACPAVTNCEDKHANYGVSAGALGSIVGFEADLGYAPDFFGKSSTQSSNVLTLTGNFLLCPKFGPVQPYGLAGIGLLRTSVNGAATSSDQNQFAYDLGAGLMIFFGQHVGIRGDVRYFGAFQVLDLVNLPPEFAVSGKNKLDFGRAAVAVVFKF